MKFSTWLDADHRCVYKSNCSFSTRKSLLSSQVRAKREKKKKLNLTTSHLFISDIQPIYTWTNVVVVQRERWNGWRNVRRSTKATLWATIASHLVLVWSMKMSRREMCVEKWRRKREEPKSGSRILYMLRVLWKKGTRNSDVFFRVLLPKHIYLSSLAAACDVVKFSNVAVGDIFFFLCFFFSSAFHHVFSICKKKAAETR